MRTGRAAAVDSMDYTDSEGGFDIVDRNEDSGIDYAVAVVEIDIGSDFDSLEMKDCLLLNFDWVLTHRQNLVAL